MWDTYATNNTTIYLQYKACNTYLQWDTYTTNSAILHALHIYKKNTATCTTYITDYRRYKNQKIKRAGKYGKF